MGVFLILGEKKAYLTMNYNHAIKLALGKEKKVR